MLGVLCVLLVAAGAGQCEHRDVRIDQGVVRGHNVDDDGVFSFYGIPYATAPTGKDIFKAPLSPPKWTDIFNATDKKIICPQRPIFSDTFLQLNRTIDCLGINIFMPNTTKTKLPVMLYIHGGSWQEGYGMIFQPVGLARKGIIAVNINFRLGVHGFLCLGTEFAPGNAGLKDQVAALKWLKRNIVQFRGDPDNIAIAGSSSGSVSVELLMLSPMANGLFSKVVTESGSALLTDFVTTEPLMIAKSFADQFIDTNQSALDLELFYKEFSQDVLTAGYVSKSGELGFLPCIETHNFKGVDKFLEEHPKDIVEKGKYKNLRLLTGFTLMEGLELIGNFNSSKPLMETNFATFLPSYLEFESDIEKTAVSVKVKNFYFPDGKITYQGFVNYYTDIIFTYPQLFSARKYAKRMPVYLFLYSFNGTLNLPSILNSAPIWGPGHVAESLYIQDYDYKPMYENMTADDFLIRDRLRELWVNFFKYGEPIPARTGLLDTVWLPMDQDHDYFLDIDVQLQLSECPMKERVALWDSIYRSSSSPSSKSLSAFIVILVSLFVTLM